jgi:hypothetical protein
VKQLNSLTRRMAAMKSSTSSRRPRRQAAMGRTDVNVPIAIQSTLRNTSQHRIHVENGREQIGTWTVTPDTPAGAVATYQMNPLTLNSNRLKNLAAVYQKYRFTKMRLQVQSSVNVTVNGLYVAGYNSNPDAELLPGNAAQAVSTFGGSVSSNVWLSQTVDARIEDPKKWYNLDADSEEVMMTTQGYFAVVNQVTPTNMTGPITFPIWLDYTIQFTGTAINSPATGPAILFPNGEFGYSSVTGEHSFTIDPDEAITVPSTSSGQVFSLSPAYTLATEGTPVLANCVIARALGYQFANSLDDLYAGKYVIGNTSTSSPVLRAQWTRLN